MTLKINFIALLLTLGSLPLWAQKSLPQEVLANNLRLKRNFAEAIAAYKQAENLYLSQNRLPEAMYMKYMAAICLLETEDWERSEALSQTWDNWQGLELMPKVCSLQIAADLAQRRGEQLRLQELKQHLIDFARDFKVESPQEQGQAVYAYTLLGRLLMEKQQRDQGGVYADLALSYADKLDLKNTLIALRLQRLVLELQMNLEAIKRFRFRAEQVNKALTGDLESEEAILGGSYLEYYAMRDTAKLRPVLHNFEAFVLRHYGEESWNAARLYMNIGVVYKDAWAQTLLRDMPKQTQAVKRSHDYTKRSIALQQKLLLKMPNMKHELGLAYRNLAYLIHERDPKALPPGLKDSTEIYFYRAVYCMLDAEHWDKPAGFIPNFEDSLLVTHNWQVLAINLRALSGYLYERWSSQPEDKQRQARFWQSKQALEQLSRRLSQSSQTGEERSLGEDMLAAANQHAAMYYLETWERSRQNVHIDSALWYQEQDYASKTRINLSTEALFEQAGVPSDLSADYTRQKKALQVLHGRRNAARRERRTELFQSLSEAISRSQLAFEALEQSIKADYPRYEASMRALFVPSVAQIQAKIEPGTACISSIFHKGAYDLIFILKDTVFNETAGPWIQHELKNDFLPLLSKLPEGQEAKLKHKAQFVRLAHKYFKDRFANAHPIFQTKGIKHLIYTSAGGLGNLPLELLLCQETDSTVAYKDMDFMLKHYSIQYVPSLALWYEAMQLGEAQGGSSARFLAYAPVYGGAADTTVALSRSPGVKALRASLSPLAGAAKEVENLQAQYAGQFHLGQAANEGQFKADLNGSYDIIHLAMHGLLDLKTPNMSALAFTETGDSTEDNFLYAYEIAQLRSPAKLVVLSACETGIGQNQSGEGTMSLARYFLYGGTPALIATRWQVNDFSTSWIMKRFYDNLSQGLPIHEAMQKAQLAYLANADAGADEPFFWAPYLNIGYTNRRIVPRSKYADYLFWGGLSLGLGALLGLAYYVMRRRKLSA